MKGGGGPYSYYNPATFIVMAIQALCNDPLMFSFTVFLHL